MYIIVSTTTNYKGKIIGHDCINRAGTIGHEIHITRPILLFLLCNILISENDTIVTKNNERFFLYCEIFKNIIEYDNLPPVNEDQILDITHMNSLFEQRYNINFKIDLEETFPILKNMRLNQVEIRTDKFDKLMSKIKYVEVENMDKEYIVFHHRHTNYGYNIDPKYRQMHLEITIEIIKILLHFFPTLNIVIFTIVDPHLFSIHSDNIKFINRIDTYASYMNNEKCKAVISTFSGGGQLAQYCHNKQIYYMNEEYTFFKGRDIEEVFNIANNKYNMYLNFDAKKITNANILGVDNLQDIIDDLTKKNV